ncbi:MAG: FecR domain-containing protein [Bacteroidota bacterium]
MERQEAEALILKYTEGNCTPDEKRVVETYFLKYLQTAEQLPEADRLLADHQEIWGHLAAYIGEEQPVGQEGVKKLRLWPGIAVAAAAVAAVVFGVWFYTSRHLEGSAATRDLLVNDIAPGRSGATITLGNGKVIELSSDKKGVVIGDELKYSDGSTDPSLSRSDISPSGGERSVMLIAQTARGQTYEFVLPDRTKVWLNADSKISFPNQFIGKERKILLSGEAYFAVAHNAKQPFRVESNGQVVEDIGTEFNINAYDDEVSVKTTLVEGMAKVTPLSPQGGSITLRPNQQATLSPLEGEMPAGQRGVNNIKVTQVNPNEVLDWKNGEFQFNDEPLGSIMRKVARWYNVEVIYKDINPDKPFWGTISRFENISKVLEKLELTGTIHFKVEGRKVYVSQ